MQKVIFGKAVLLSVAAAVFLTGCGQPVGNGGNSNAANATANAVNSNANMANANANANANTAVSSVTVETKEPEQYQAKVALKFEATGDNQTTALPAIAANVARNASDRVMEFALPTGEKVIYLDKAGTNYLILPNRKQYAELDKESLGFEVRRMLMPEQIVSQVKAMKGVQMIGEENVNGRTAIKYAYSGTANTQTNAGKVATESFILVDKETGLPLHSETLSQSESGSNVQDYKGLRLVTDMSDIKPTADAALFVVPPDYQKIDSAQVKDQANLIFNVVATFIGQMLKQGQPNANQTNANTTASPMNQ